MWLVKIGTRLTLMLLLGLTPVLAGYTYWVVQRSNQIYTSDLKRETRATARSLRAAIDNDFREGRWHRIGDLFTRIRRDGIAAAVFNSQGGVWYRLDDFPGNLTPETRKFDIVNSEGSVEFERWAEGKRWFCRLLPLSANGHPVVGYLLVAQDWTKVSEDLKARALGSVIAALAVMVLIALMVPLAVQRYISMPLAELSRRVTARFSTADDLGRSLAGDEVRLLTQEFRRLDHQLTDARSALLEKHRLELELERRLLHSDRLATIGTLASGLAHEIGTPLGVIRGRAEYLLHSKPESPKTAEGLEVIVNQIDRISRIVRMLLDYARRREPLRVTCDVRPIVRRALHLIETEAARRNVQVFTELGEETLTVQCDADQLQQVFVNLGMNALDAMASTGGMLRVATQADGDDCLKLVFEDTGPGVPEQHRHRVFDPFFTTKEPGKGTGMGLAVSQSIMRDHEGEITFDSGPEGSRFFVTMPMAQSAKPPDGESPMRMDH
jgi:two-component system, NtrC family, sensor kinase